MPPTRTARATTVCISVFMGTDPGKARDAKREFQRLRGFYRILRGGGRGGSRRLGEGRGGRAARRFQGPGFLLRFSGGGGEEGCWGWGRGRGGTPDGDACWGAGGVVAPGGGGGAAPARGCRPDARQEIRPDARQDVV